MCYIVLMLCMCKGSLIFSSRSKNEPPQRKTFLTQFKSVFFMEVEFL